MPPKLSYGAWWPRLLLLLLGLGPDTPGLGSGCLWGLRRQSPQGALGQISQVNHPLIWTGSCRTRERGGLGGKGFPSPTCRHLQAPGSAGAETQHQAWTLVIFMDQTLGGALDSLLGCSLPELSGRTLETIYSPKVLGTQAAAPRSPGKPPGLAILGNIFD